MSGALARPVYRHAALRRLLNPASIAVVGATAREGAFGARVIAHLAGFAGPLHLVNARYDRLGERPCFPSVAALPETPDCAVICVAREAVEAVVLDCAGRGVGGAIIFASGYAEVGREERAAEQQRLAAIARETGLRIVGPNCIGLVNYAAGARLTFSAIPDAGGPAPHAIGVVSQSGALGFAMALAVEHGSSVSHVLTSGNSCDVDMADYVAYLADDPACRAIACLFEGMAQPQRFIEAAEIAWAADKPLVVYKIAVGESGARAAMSHTGSLAGSDAAYRAAFARAGVLQVDDFEAVMETAAFFAKAPPPRAPGVAVAATSGGAAIMAADKAEAHGIALPQPAPETTAILEQHIPEFGSARNPCDVTAQVLTSPESLAACAGALLADPAFGALLVPSVYAYAPAARRIPLLSGLAGEAGKLICQVWVNEHLEGPGAAEAERDPNTALFRSMNRCFATLAMWHARAARRARPHAAPARRAAPGAREAAARLLDEAEGSTLGERAAKTVLALYGVPVVGEALAHSAEEAVAAAEAAGMPVVLKVESPDLPHKTEAGVIRLNLKTAAEVRAAHAEVIGNAARAGARVTGVLVQPMVPAGTEIIVGGRVDPLFGPLIVVGLGGVLVELLQDTAVEIAPVGQAEARAMLDRLKAQAALTGFRGSAPVDRDRLADIVARLSEFLADQAGRVAELDVNPLICAGPRIVAVDALIVRGPA